MTDGQISSTARRRWTDGSLFRLYRVRSSARVTHSWRGSNGRPMSALALCLAGGVCDAS